MFDKYIASTKHKPNPISLSLISVLSKSQYGYFLGSFLQKLAFFIPILTTLLYLYAYYYLITHPGVSLSAGVWFPLCVILALIIGMVYLLWMFPKLDYLAKRLKTPAAEALIARDSRPPVLYLRSFTDDVILPFNGMWGHSEQVILEVVKAIGPLIAIGQPGDILPPPGASRLYLDHNEWQVVVKKHMVKSQFVILSAEYTPGVLWELFTSFQLCKPKNIIISLLGFQARYDAQALYGSFREATLNEAEKHNISIRLPNEIGKSSFIYFSDKGEPELSEPNWNEMIEMARIFSSKGIEMGIVKLERKFTVLFFKDFIWFILIAFHLLAPALIILGVFLTAPSKSSN